MKTVPGNKKDPSLIVSTSSALLFLAGMAAISPVSLAEGMTNFGSRTPTQEEFTRALTPAKPGMGEGEEVRFRGIRPVAPEASKHTEPAVSMQLTFAFNSDKLSSQAEHTLNNLGKALQGEELKADVFRIEGHTDSKGSNAYNQRLSERRAQSVARYLVERFKIESKRLQSVGKGEDEPLNPNDPENPENRRVQIVNLGS
jgi:outer membrane protein OmpA-like peptidoglycan-associated protein